MFTRRAAAARAGKERGEGVGELLSPSHLKMFTTFCIFEITRIRVFSYLLCGFYIYLLIIIQLPSNTRYFSPKILFFYFQIICLFIFLALEN